MSAIVTQVFDQLTDPSGIDESAWFSGADFLFFTAPALPPGDGYEIAGSLIVDVVGEEVIGGVPISVAYGVREVPLPIEFYDSRAVVRIPSELARSELSMRVCIATAYAISLEVYAVASEGAGDLGPLLDAIQQILDLLTVLDLSGLVAVLSGLISIAPAILTFIISGNPVPILIGGTALLLPPP